MNKRLVELLEQVNNCAEKCTACFGTGKIPTQDDYTDDACGTCGGYGFNVRGDIREVVLDIRAELEKTA